MTKRSNHHLFNTNLATRALFRSPPIVSVAVGTATAIATEKLAGKVMDKAADQAASKTLDTAKDVIGLFTGVEFEKKDDKGDTVKSEETKPNPKHNSSSHQHTPDSNQQKRSITTRTSINITPQRQEQSYDYVPNNKLDQMSTEDALNKTMGNIGPEAAHELESDLAGNKDSASDTEESRNKVGPTEFVKSTNSDRKAMWHDLKHELNEAVDITRSSVRDVQNAVADKVENVKRGTGAILGAGMGDGLKMGEAVRSVARDAGQAIRESLSFDPSTSKPPSHANDGLDRPTMNEAGEHTMNGVPTLKEAGEHATSEVKRSSQNVIDQIKDKAHELQDDSKNFANAKKDQAQTAAHDAVDRFQGMAHQANQSAQDTVHEAKEVLHNASSTVKHNVQDLNGRSQHLADTTKEEIKTATHDAANRVQEMAHHANEKVHDNADQAVDRAKTGYQHAQQSAQYVSNEFENNNNDAPKSKL